MTSRFFLVGDIMGKAGRQCLETFLPRIREEIRPDAIVVNGENLAGGFGVTEKIFRQLTDDFGIDCVTMGNHWHEKKDVYDLVMQSDRIVIPANMSNVKHEERGLRILSSKSGVAFAVVNVIGKIFMHGENRSPFDALDRLFAKIPESVKIRIVDIHAEATSEKQGLAQYLAAQPFPVSIVYGTHSHVPTADERLIDGRMGFVTDLGMTGAYDSVIGIRKEAAVLRLRTGEKKNFEPAEKDPWLCAMVADIDETTGRCLRFERVKWKIDQSSAAGGSHAQN